jgi:Uma2 family endonuclease
MDERAALPVCLSVDAFLAWAPGTGQRWQLVDGAPQAIAPLSRVHGWLQGELGRLIDNHLGAGATGWSLAMSPGVVPRIMSGHNVRVPDLAVTCARHDRDERAITDPVLIVEILSARDEAQTWSNVWAYTSIPSVREIVVLRADRAGASLLRRHADGFWPERPEDLEERVLMLETINLAVPLQALYATAELELNQNE